MERYKLAIIIPAFNESSTIGKIVKQVNKFGSVIVVDDASTDDTFIRAKKAGATVIKNKENMKYDLSLGIGIKKAIKMKKKFAVTFDADGQHNPRDIPEIVDHFSKDYDLILGIRKIIPRFSEKISVAILNMVWNIRDPYCGLKAYRLAKLKKGQLVSYNSTGTEIALNLITKGYKYKQISITTKKRKDDSRFGNIFSSNYKILKSTFISLNKYILKTI